MLCNVWLKFSNINVSVRLSKTLGLPTLIPFGGGALCGLAVQTRGQKQSNIGR
jgi:hypothetical protein